MFTQYVLGNSPIHRMKGYLKCYLLILFILLSIPINSLTIAGIYILSALILIFTARLNFFKVLKKSRHVLLLLTAGLLINLIFSDWRSALTIFLRLAAIVLTAQVLMMTTTTAELIEALETKFHLKSDYVVSIMIALAFIPILQQTWQEINLAQSARGSDWMEMGLTQKFRGLIPIMIPVFQFSIQKAEVLGEALTMKGYHS